MEFPKLLPLAAVFAVALLSSCETAPPSSPEVQANWPGVKFTEVRGYCYDYTAEWRNSFWAENRMHKGVLDPKGVKLSPSQTKRLLAAIRTSHPESERRSCYKPHHAFLFFNERHQVVAAFEVCFSCNKYVSSPAGAPQQVDKVALYNLCHELGLPLGVGNKYYSEVCKGGVNDRR